MRPTFLIPVLLLPGLVASCYTGGSSVQNSAAGAGGNAAGGQGGGGSGGAIAETGLPCDVAQLMQSRCVSCHNAPPVSGVPMSLVTRADLLAPSKSDPAKTVAQLSLERMQTGGMPPKPSSPPTPAEIAVLQGWISSGTPAGSCGSDGGTGGGAPDPLNASASCTSATYWDGESSGYQMAPGQACVSCHAGSGEAPLFAVAGTVYPTGHEPNGCNGANGQTGSLQGAAVVLADGNGQAIATLPVNAAGNFTYDALLAQPFYAKVTFQGKERVMTMPVPNGDCNTCHTAAGANNAPGRITLPP